MGNNVKIKSYELDNTQGVQKINFGCKSEKEVE